MNPVDDSPSTLIGKVIADRFVVERLIAHGGMGSVYVAEQTALGRKVALKVLRADLTKDGERFMQRLMHEAAATARLQHPSIVTVYDFGSYRRGHYYLAMEYVDGPNLGALVTREGPLPPYRGQRLALQVARAMRTAHAAGLIHRDLKPGNILVTRDEEGDELAKVVDFGLAKDTNRGQNLTQDGSILGSPKYMPPEQSMQAQVDHRADIYSFGVTFYAALVGRVPFEGPTIFETIRMHREEPIPRMVRDDGVPIPAPLERLIRWCMAKQPEDRPQQMQDIVGVLKGLGAPGGFENAISDPIIPFGDDDDDKTDVAGPAIERYRDNPAPRGVRPLSASEGAQSALSLASAWKKAASPSAPHADPALPPGAAAPAPPPGALPRPPSGSRPLPSSGAQPLSPPSGTQAAGATDGHAELDTRNMRVLVTAAAAVVLLLVIVSVAWRVVRHETRRPETPIPEDPIAAVEAPTARRVHLLITSAPPGAEVFLGTRSLGLTPLDTSTELPEGVDASLRVVKRGFWPATVEIPPEALELSEQVALEIR